MSDIKCPFCGKKLWYDEQDGIYRCMKFGCVMDYEGGTEQLWQELIQTKKELENTKEKIEQLENELAEELNGASVNTSDLWKHEQTHYGEPHLLELMDEWGVDGTNYADFRSVIQEHCLNKGLYAFADIEKVWKEHIKSLKKAVKSIKGDKND